VLTPLTSKLHTPRTLLWRAGRLCILPQQPSPKERELHFTGFNKLSKLHTPRTLLWRAGRLCILYN